MQNKRFWFSCLSIICVSAVTYFLKYDAVTYKWLIGIVCGVYTGFQSWTDIKKLGGSNGDSR